MNFWRSLGAGLLGLVFCLGAPAPAATRATASDFHEALIDINRSSNHPDRRNYFPAELRGKLGKIHVLFVSGYLNEALPLCPLMKSGYWHDNIEALVEFGVPRDHIHTHSPGSHLSVEQTIAPLIRTLLYLQMRDDEKLIIVGHSKGAFLSVVTAARMASDYFHREFLRRKVLAIVPIQMAAGSHIADYFYHWYGGFERDGLSTIPWQQMYDKDKPLFNSAVFAAMGVIAGGVVAPALKFCGQLRGLESLTTYAAARLMDRVGQECSGHELLLSQLFLSIGASEEVERMPQLLRPMGQFLAQVAPAYEGSVLPVDALGLADLLPAGNSDGLAMTATMTPSFLKGTNACTFALLKMDHATPAQGRFVGNDPVWVRRAIMGALMRVLLEHQ